jgi:hypothetical protein
LTDFEGDLAKLRSIELNGFDIVNFHPSKTNGLEKTNS